MRASRWVSFGFGLGLTVVGLTSSAAQATIDRTRKYQTIDGFGFFGAMDVWWGSAANLYDPAWGKQVIDDLGISIWRNEYYPPADATDGQDADWNKQKPVVVGLKQAADASKVPLKFIFTVWTPPSSMKCDTDADNLPIDGTEGHSTKNGGALCRSSRDAYAQWLVDGITNYQDAGVKLYALSFQNEPLFVEPYNSCVYQAAYYADTLSVIAPKVRATFPDVKFYGSENMLAIEAGTDGQWFYSQAITDNAAALAELDLWAVHGYSDGLAPTPTSQMSQLWAAFESKYNADRSKPVWMTETSGYDDNWDSGPMNVAFAIYSALAYGDISAWVWWQGSQSDSIGAYNLMQALTKNSKRYYVHKQFARYVRPGARRVEITSDDPEVFTVAFEHAGLDSLTVVAINSATSDKTLTLTGANLPADYQLIRSSATEDAVDAGTSDGSAVSLPARSVTTLVHGAYREADAPVGAGGGANGNAGSAGSGAVGAGTGGSSAGGSNAGGAGGAAASADSSGCGCRAARSGDVSWWSVAVLGALVSLRRRRAGF